MLELLKHLFPHHFIEIVECWKNRIGGPMSGHCPLGLRGYKIDNDLQKTEAIGSTFQIITLITATSKLLKKLLRFQIYDPVEASLLHQHRLFRKYNSALTTHNQVNKAQLRKYSSHKLHVAS